MTRPGRGHGRGHGLAARMLMAQILVIAAGAVTLLVTAVLVAPGLFHDHLARSGVSDPAAVEHAEEAFAVAFGIALPAGTLAALLAAGAVSWFLVRRLALPIEQLAEAADAIAAGDTDVDLPDGGFSTEMQQLAASFAGMAERLAHVDASRARMLSDLSHEIRTPLATLEAYLEGMEDGVVPLDEQSWTTARRQVERLRRLGHDVREVAAAHEHALDLHPVPVRAGEVAESAVALAAPRGLAADVTVTATGTDSPALVLADPDRLGQVLGNLLDNAIRHTPPGGTVDTAVHAAGGHVSIVVADTGMGIAEDDVEVIFERFHRGDAARTSDGSGAGLGLSIARAIVADHGGHLQASSPGIGAGARFTLTLPRLATTDDGPDLHRTFSTP